MATLKDVAAKSGVTVTTVSRVLNNRGYISDETRKKVYAAMKELNYQPNEIARSLSKQKSTTIGIIVAVVVLLVLGIKYMMGSASEKAEYKKTMIPYLVGALLIFGASAIAKAVIAISENLTAG